ncbi:hypothetical protein GLOIN_2v1495771 [Rhizophagus irregularis DAOM 181602=DAOM 197198]|uniref:3-keto-steroid reductase n=1 Tax=Rhizophagus irregularis (strain DAOM 181602 / DAOM 197198 / MUCL 43194) TaxID=747089 RepID=A0A2P4QY43_RHIID|nr:hypothetical protein GLOIN_2v1495771 [Rhizophagus irregularis DAOM 181602=DAOM 197198]POG82522.1 hypothetical protein GLOIN_2v1495771 [Rhizophagus irregularis DAOM 181602=DAOM 197198]|eukprot:XP_025189388.1 hypothetical protein GLOIN_2v1495771 [Rhizophagus irregularis DAOM 181602=DAOM 197198]
MNKKRNKRKKRNERNKPIKDMSTVKIALITGANRLLDHSAKNTNEQFKIVLACRNKTRAIDAQNALLKEFTGGLVEIVLVDVSSVKSVFECCKEVKKRFNRIDLIFCNAGILPCTHVDWSVVAKQLVFSPIALMSRTDCIVQPVGKTTAEGLGETFACNVFGHYVMIRELENLLIKTKNSRIIWTSSCTATKENFNLEDYQAIKENAPYESSKRMTDLIAIGLNSRLNKHDIYSFATHPGIAATNIVRDHLGWVMGYGMLIGLFAARTFLGMRNQTVTNWNGSYSNYYVATQPIDLLNNAAIKKFGSYCNRFGEVYVDTDDIEDYNEVETEALFNKLNKLLDEFRVKYNIKS